MLLSRIDGKRKWKRVDSSCQPLVPEGTMSNQIYTVLGLVEMTHVDESVDLELDPVTGFGHKSIPAMLMFVKLE